MQSSNNRRTFVPGSPSWMLLQTFRHPQRQSYGGKSMQITQHPEAESLELRLTGRLDATWADHLSNTIEGAVKSGSHRIVLNMAGVRYISSLGVGVLVRQLQLLQSVN